ncbi:MAG: glycerophosphodiester phosphodiesterase family protein [Planctomycetaceae bacterium]
MWTEVVPYLKADLAKVGKKPEQTCVISFSSTVCRDVKQEMPELKVYWLSSQSENKETGKWEPTIDEMINTAQSIHADGLDVNANEKVDAEFIKQVKATGLGLYVWTVNNPDQARQLVRDGIDGITTDRPAFLREAIEK